MIRLLTLLLAITLSTCSPINKYKGIPEVIRWEPEIIKFEEQNRQATYPPNSILFTGSSSIRRWESLVEDMAPYPVIQRGYGGARLTDFAVFADRITHPHQVSAIVLFIANDIAGRDSDISPREVLRLYKSVIKTIRKKHPETPVFWISITPTPSRWEAWPRIREANQLISKYSERKQALHYISTEHAFLTAEGQPREELFVADRLHLSSEGYEVWTGIIKGEIEKVLGRK